MAKQDTDRLYDYTKFHVGLYASLVFGAIAVVGVGKSAALDNPVVLICVGFAVLLWVISGFSGGVILGNLVDIETDVSLEKFRNTPIGPDIFTCMKARCWERLEHYTFWLGAISALTGFVFVAFTVICKNI